MLEQNSEGVSGLKHVEHSKYNKLTHLAFIKHTTGSSPSLCIAKEIRKYFQTGELPAPGTVCSTDFKPFLGAPKEPVMEVTEMSSTDQRLRDAVMADVSSFGFATSSIEAAGL